MQASNFSSGGKFSATDNSNNMGGGNNEEHKNFMAPTVDDPLKKRE